MLPSSHRLPGSAIPSVLASSYSFTTPNLSLKFIKTSRSLSRLGFIAPIKSFPKAPLRNQVKRRLRHASLVYLNKLKPGHDLIFIIQSSFLNLSPSQINQALKTLLKQAQLLK